MVRLSSLGTRKSLLVHRLVLLSFLGEPAKNMQTNHKNGIKTDNRLVNLEWVTAKENIRHAIDVLGKKRNGTHNSNSKLNNSQVREIKRMINNGIPNVKIAKIFKVHRHHISNIKTGRRWKHAR